MFTVKGFFSPQYRKGYNDNLKTDVSLEREVFEAKTYTIARVEDDHVVLLFTDPGRAHEAQMHIGKNYPYHRVIIENSAGTNVEKIWWNAEAANNWVVA